VPRFNDLHSRYNSHGLEIVGANFADTTVDVQNFITTYGANYGIAQVADSTGYTVPMYSWVFAIDTDGTLLWSGSSSDVTDEMVEGWLGIDGGSGGGGDDDEECSTAPGNGHAWLLVLGALGAAALRRRKLHA
jgi:MYXO-CTERM domain-containing protein